MQIANSMRISRSGFTLIELLVVLAIISTLLTLSVPRYFNSLDKSKEAVLKTNLATIRDAIDKYYADKGRYPDSLATLADERYLISLPTDPITESSETWVIVPPEDPDAGGMYDIHSGAEGEGKNGTAYSEW